LSACVYRPTGNCWLISNTASNNGGGIVTYYSSNNNTIYHNNCINNTNHNARDTGTNTWDSGSEGNYYSDYTGTDPDGDGIGETSYDIPGGESVDRYPLMQPWNSDAPHHEVTLTPVGITEGTLPNHAKDVCVSGNYAYVADYYNGLVVVDISDPTKPETVGNHPSRTEGYTTAAAIGVAVSGDYVYVANCYDDLYVINVTDPNSPTLAATYDPGDSAYAVTISDDYAYISSMYNGVDIIAISDPTNPEFVGNYDTDDVAEDVAISGSYAYIADRSDGVIIIDISNPADPAFVGSCDTPVDANTIVVSGNHAYVADEDNGLVIIDVSDPVAPAIVGHYDTNGSAWGVTISGNYVYVGDGPTGVVVINISDPTNPMFAGGYDTPGYAKDLELVGDLVYVADDHLVILRTDASDAQLLGDLNGDGTITPADAAIALRLAAGSRPCDPTTLAAADVSGDGRVTSLDALIILRAAETLSNVITWHSYDEGMGMIAGAQNKTAMINVYTSWCKWCQKMDRVIYTDPDVIDLADQFVCIQIDADYHRDLAARYNPRGGVPTIVFIRSNDTELHRISGYPQGGAEAFIREMRVALINA